MPTVDQYGTMAARAYSRTTIGNLLFESRDARSGGAITPSHLSLELPDARATKATTRDTQATDERAVVGDDGRTSSGRSGRWWGWRGERGLSRSTSSGG